MSYSLVDHEVGGACYQISIYARSRRSEDGNIRFPRGVPLLPKSVQSDKLCGLDVDYSTHYSLSSHGLGSCRQSEQPRTQSSAELPADGTGGLGFCTWCAC